MVEIKVLVRSGYTPRNLLHNPMTIPKLAQSIAMLPELREQDVLDVLTTVPDRRP